MIRALVLFLRALAAVGKRLPKNPIFYAYTIEIGRVRWMLHWIHRPDIDRHPHNHPWLMSTSRILTGGYVERRVVGFDTNETAVRELGRGDTNEIAATDFHIIESVQPDTWTLFIAGERVQTWGFLVAPNTVVEHASYREWCSLHGEGRP